MAVFVLCFLTLVAGLFTWWQNPGGTLVLQGATLVWVGGLVLLGYGFIRDLYLLFAHRKDTHERPEERFSMLCVESTIGMVAVGLGLGLQALDWTRSVAPPVGSLMAAGALIVAFGHATRDWVLLLVEVENHSNLIPTWKINRWVDVAGKFAPPE